MWALLVLVALVPFVLIGGPLSGWLDDLGLVDREQRFTELSFPRRADLPTSVFVGAPISFDIELGNREGDTTTYRWEAVVEAATSEPGPGVELASGRVRLDDGEVRRIGVVGTAPAPAGTAVVRVSLVARDESIDFRLEIVAVADDPSAAG